MREKRRGGVQAKVALSFFIVAVLIAAQFSGLLPAITAHANNASAASTEQPEAAQQASEEAAGEQAKNEEETSGYASDDTTPNATADDDQVNEGADAASLASAGTAPLEAFVEDAAEVDPLADSTVTDQASLQAALTSATAGDTITLTQDIELTSVLTIPNVSLTLDGNNHKLTLASGYTGAHVTAWLSTAGSTLTIKNLSFIGHNTGPASYENASARITGGGLLFNGSRNADLAIENCTFTGNHNTSAIQVKTAKATIISGSTFTNNSAQYGGAVNFQGSLQVSGSYFSGNYASLYGGALCATLGNSPATISTSQFVGNEANASGGAFSNGDPHGTTANTLTATNCVFSGNKAVNGDGGALYTRSEASLYTLTNCTFAGNYAKENGGAARLTYTNITECDFSNNESGASGGAIVHNYQAGQLIDIEGGSFTNNTAGKTGGAISSTPMYQDAANPPYNICTFLEINGTSFSGNYAGSRYHYIDFENPVDLEVFSHVGNATYDQTALKEYYETHFTNIDGYSAGPTPEKTSKHILNTYDVEMMGFAAVIAKGSAASWSDGSTATQRQFTFFSDTIDNNLTRLGKSISRDGKVVVGWLVYDQYTPGYTADDGIKITGGTTTYTVLRGDYYVRGCLVMTPLFADAVDVTYHFGGETVGDSDNPYAASLEVTKNDTIAGDAVAVKEPATLNAAWAAPTGYTFAGWATTEDPVEGETLYVPGATSGSFVIEGDTDLYARFAPNIHIVTFESNGGSVVAPQQVSYGEAAVAPSAPTYPGYSFEGWYSDSALTAPWNFSTVVTADMTLYAKWVAVAPPVTYYDVTYAPGAYGTFVAQTSTVASGDPTPAAPYITAQTGWRFTGWSPVPSATVTSSVTYTAQWTQIEQPVNTYTVTFVDWDGTVLKTEQVTSGGNATPPADPTRTGYRFDSWEGTYANVTADTTVTARYLIQPSSSANSLAPGTTTSFDENESQIAINVLINDPSIPTLKIGGLDIPLHAGPYSHLVWAFVNLVLMVIGVILALVTLIFRVSKKSKNGTAFAKGIGLVGLLIAGIMAVVGIVVFFLTENMTQPVVLTDSWTPLSAVILVLGVIGAVVAIRYASHADETKDDPYVVENLA